MFNAQNSGKLNLLPPCLTETFQSTIQQNMSNVQGLPARQNHENFDAHNNRNESEDSSKDISVNHRGGANYLPESSKADPNSTKDQAQPDSSEDTDSTQREPQFASLVSRPNKTRYQNDNQTKKQKNRGNKDFESQQPQKVDLSHKPNKTTAGKSSSFEHVEGAEGGTDEQSETLKHEEDEYSDGSEDDTVEVQSKQALLAHSSNPKTIYKKRENLDHRTKKQKNTEDFKSQQPQRVNLFRKPNKSEAGKTTADESRGSIEKVEGGNNEPNQTLTDVEEGASRNNENSHNGNDKTPNEKQPVKSQKCRKIARIIIYVVVTLFAILGCVGFIIALNQTSSSHVATEPTKLTTDVAWSPWGGWTNCSVTCGQGLQHRSRNCTQHVPSLFGRYCANLSVDYRLCLGNSCQATDEAWSPWGGWTECSVTCGQGLQHRSRNCTQPVPSLGSRYCTDLSVDYRLCVQNSCSVSFRAFTAVNPKQIQSEKLQSWDVLYQSGSDFDPTTGTFTSSVPGVYLFALTLVKKGSQTNPVAKVHCHMYQNDEQVMSLILSPSYDTGNDAISSTAVLRLDEGDRVYLGLCTDPESTLEKWTSFTGVLQSTFPERGLNGL